MPEFYGWLNVLESYDREEETNIWKIIDEAKHKLKSDNLDDIFTLSIQQGEFLFSVNFISKRFTVKCQAIIDFYIYISKSAKGSYGFLYYRNDDSDDKKIDNKFIVLRIAKGEVKKFRDTLIFPNNQIFES